MERFIVRRMTWLDAHARELEIRGEVHQALVLREELYGLSCEHFASDHPWRIERLWELAFTYRRADRPRDAERIYRELLVVLERSPDDPKLAQVLNALGVLLCECQEPQRAVVALRRALDLSIERLAPDDPSLANLHSNLGNAHHALGQAHEARRHYLEALRILPEQIPRPERIHCLLDLADLLSAEDDDGAAELLAEALGLVRRFHGQEPGKLARALVRIASLYARIACVGQAIELLEDTAVLLRDDPCHQGDLAHCLELLSELHSAHRPTG